MREGSVQSFNICNRAEPQTITQNYWLISSASAAYDILAEGDEDLRQVLF